MNEYELSMYVEGHREYMEGEKISTYINFFGATESSNANLLSISANFAQAKKLDIHNISCGLRCVKCIKADRRVEEEEEEEAEEGAKCRRRRHYFYARACFIVIDEGDSSNIDWVKTGTRVSVGKAEPSLVPTRRRRLNTPTTQSDGRSTRRPIHSSSKRLLLRRRRSPFHLLSPYHLA